MCVCGHALSLSRLQIAALAAYIFFSQSTGKTFQYRYQVEILIQRFRRKFVYRSTPTYSTGTFYQYGHSYYILSVLWEIWPSS